MKQYLWLVCLLCNFLWQATHANDPAYEQRRLNYISTGLNSLNDNAIVLQAYQNQPVDSALLQSVLNIIPTKSTSDFDIVKLVRILFLTNGEYDTLILNTLNNIPFWLNQDDTLRGYWSENHMIMWMSTDWLIHQKYGRPIDANLENRLRHYLRIKQQYGFYEFFSTTYLPYTLSGLLNLADFAQDSTIKQDAALAAQKLLGDLLLHTNNKGVTYPAAGRNFHGRYTEPYGQNHNNLIYLLTGMGAAPTAASHSGVFLATSTIPVDSIIQSWKPEVDTLFSVGQPFDSTNALHNVQPSPDRTLFKWSMGGYFHPNFVVETTDLIADYNIWRHVDFTAFNQLASLPPALYPGLSNSLSVASKSTVLTGQRVAIFKKNQIALSSIQDYWKGKLGYQQFPCVANVGTTAVYTAVGNYDSTWLTGSGSNSNEHLPYVAQKKNVALLMYRPEPKPSLLPYFNNEVSLRWIGSDMDEQVTIGNWLIGRQQQGYVAARRYCLDTIRGNAGCLYNTDGQAWVLVVGDSTMYGSFQQFQTKVQQAQFTEQRYYDAINEKSVYYAKIVFDTTTIEHAWEIDSVETLGIASLALQPLRVFPNPANQMLFVDASSLQNGPLSIQVHNVTGATVYNSTVQSATGSNLSIPTASFAKGMYWLTVQQNGKTYQSRFVKTE